MKRLLFITIAFMLFSCDQKPKQHEKGSSISDTTKLSRNVKKTHEDKSFKSKQHASLRYFEMKGIWDTLASICPAQQMTKFHINNFTKTNLTNIDSTLIFNYLTDIYGLESIYPLKLIDYSSGWKGLIFFGEQYDADRITEFLAIATIDSTFNEKGQLEAISGKGNVMGESWEYYTEFLNDTAFKLTRMDDNSCEDALGNPITGEISKLQYEQSFLVSETGTFNKITTDTVKAEICKECN